MRSSALTFALAFGGSLVLSVPVSKRDEDGYEAVAVAVADAAEAFYPTSSTTAPSVSTTVSADAISESLSESTVVDVRVLAVTESTSSSPSTSSPQGHWQVFTTSTWIADAVSASASASSAVSASVSANDVVTNTTNALQETDDQDGGWHFSLCVGLGRDCDSTTTTSTTYAISSTVTSLPVPTTLSTASTAITVSISSATAGSTTISASTTSTSTSAQASGTASSDKHVFAHFMVGIVSTYQTADWVSDMQLAKSKGITGFALNIGVDSYTQDQLDLAYDAAAQVGDFDLFISFDFNWYSVSDTSGVATMMKRYVDKPAQLLIDGKPFVSSFIGDGFDWTGCASQVGRAIYAMPFNQPTAQYADDAGISGLFSWAAWPGQLDNQPILQNMTMDRDDSYLDVLKAAGKQYMAPISPWFNTHFGPEVSYSKNWLFYSEMLWKTRWDQVLQMGAEGVKFVEIVTWNDYGESHHVGPYSTPHTDDGASKWASGLDHSAMLDFAVPYIEAFKQGKTEPVISSENLVYWHRPHLKSASCDSTDNCGSKPTGWDMVSDAVFVATMTINGGTVTVTSGSNSAVTHAVEAGVQVFEVPMAAGVQSFKLETTAGLSASGSSNVTVTNTCWNGIYNFNFHSGTVA